MTDKNNKYKAQEKYRENNPDKIKSINSKGYLARKEQGYYEERRIQKQEARKHIIKTLNLKAITDPDTVSALIIWGLL